jgi:Icc-related predicted phosphoesterase
MKILALSDDIVPFIHSSNVGETFPEVDLILGCGDLPARYLEFVLTVLNVPCVYVPGNHDRDNLRVPGAVNADGRLVRAAGLRIMGFGGSPRYKPDGRHQYSESQMKWRIRRRYPQILWPAWRGRRAFDILLTHAPPRNIHDAEDPAHLGFHAFLDLMDLARPKLMVHGHTHVIPNLATTETRFHDTLVVNAYPHKLISLPGSGAAHV